MTSLVIDASVAVKWFLPEERSDQALLNCGMVTADARLYHAVEKRLPYVQLLGDSKSAQAE